MADKPSVDDLRARLRELGYLDAGVDRFVLAPVRGSRGLVSVAWRSSARIGLLAALLLGPSAALALGVRLPNLVTGVRDAAILTLYLGLLFGAAVTVVAFGAALLLGTVASRSGERARVASRAPFLSRTAALLVSAACLVYLVFWWRAVSAGAASSLAAAWTWLVLAGATAVSLLLGHAVGLTTLAMVAREAGDASSGLLHFRRSRGLTLAVGVLAFALGAALLFVVPAGSDRSQASVVPAFQPVPTGVSLTVVAIDGVDAEYLDRLLRAGRVPTLGRLLAGARASLPASDAPDPARTWTSIATGQPAAVHGVSGIETRRVSGIEGTVGSSDGGVGGVIAAATDLLRLTRPALTTSLQRRSKTFWEVAAEHGISTVVVNWWATWPVPRGRGTILSDRATLRLEVGGEQDAEIAPPGLYPTLRARWPSLREQVRRRVAEAFGSDATDQAAAALRRAAEQDALALALAGTVSPQPARLCAIYLPGLDIAQHELLGSGGAGLPAAALAARVEALGRYYDFLDSLVASLVGTDEGGRLVALIADPGRSPSRSSAVLALDGPPARHGARVQMPRDDVAPTLLYALGLPISRELPGRPRTDLFDAAFATRVPVRFVPTYGSGNLAPRPTNATPLDREMLDRLRSLGYVR